MSSETISQVAAPTQAPAVNAPLPTLDEIASSFSSPEETTQEEPTQAPPQNTEPETEPAPTPNEWAELSEQQRNVFREKHKLKQEKAALEKSRVDQDKRFADLETMVDEFMGTDPENQPGQHGFDPEQYKKEIQDEIMKKVEDMNSQKDQAKQEDQQITTFKEGVSSYLDEKNADFPLTSSMKQADLVFEIIEQQYQKDSQEFGSEYAASNMLTKEGAAKKAEEHLASEVGKMLQSESVRGYLLKQLQSFGNDPQNDSVLDQSEQGNQSNNAPTTLTNDFAQTTTQNGFIDQTIESDDQAFQRALSLVP